MKSVAPGWLLALWLAAGLNWPAFGAEAVERPNEYRQIAPSVWIHTSYKDLGSGIPFPSNGLLVRTGSELLLIDTAWTDTQTREVLAWAESELGIRVTQAIVTHAHDDKMGGIGTLHDRGISTVASELTNRLAPQHDLKPARRSLDLAEPMEVAPGIEAFYPGAGHTTDNIVIYLSDVGVLFGGCLIRPADTSSLGYTADADLDHWAAAVEAVRDRYGEAKIVVPSHGAPGDPSLLDHTIDLAGKTTEVGSDSP